MVSQKLGYFPCGSAGKESACNVGDLGSIPGLGRCPGEGKSYPLQYIGLENSMDCIISGSQRVGHRLSDFHPSLITNLICIPEIYIQIYIQVYIQWIHESILSSMSQMLPFKASSLIWWRIIIAPAYMLYVYRGLPGGSVVKNLPANAGDVGSIPG